MSVARTVLGNALLAGAPHVPVEAARSLASDLYGITGHIETLPGEKDSNFLIRGRDGAAVLLKVIHPDEDRAVTAMQTGALRHAAQADPDLPVQRVIATRAGASDTRARLPDGTDRAVRLVGFIDGVTQGRSERSAAQRRSIGAALARLQRALADYSHPADGHRLVWDVAHAADLRPLLGSIPDRADRGLLHRRLDVFEERAAPRLAGLRRQVVHNDLNPGNLLVDAADPTLVRGILDFGDTVRTAVVIDVAVAAAYQLASDEAPLAGGLDLLRGFAAVRPLGNDEIAILFDLILTRLSMRLLIAAGRAAASPHQDRMRPAPRDVEQLRRLDALPPQQALDEIGAACLSGSGR